MREGLAEVEERVAREGDAEDDAAAIHLGAGPPEQETYNVTAQEDGGDEVAQLARNAKLGGDKGARCRWGRGRERAA